MTNLITSKSVGYSDSRGWITILKIKISFTKQLGLPKSYSRNALYFLWKKRESQLSEWGLLGRA